VVVIADGGGVYDGWLVRRFLIIGGPE